MSYSVTPDDVLRGKLLLQDLQSKVNDVTLHVDKLIKRVENADINTAKGVSFLEVKYHMLLSYVLNLSHIIAKKASGQSIKDDPTVERLVEIRTVLEKMRPIDQKLKYQIDKAIKTAATGAVAENDPLRFRANPENLVSKVDEDSEGSSGDEEGSGSEDEDKTKSKVYKPPKITPMHYDLDETQKDRQEKRMERVKKKIASSSIMKDIRDEYYDGPEEIRDSADMHRGKEDKAGKEREDYEMKYFVRMALTKKDKAAARKVRTIAALDDITKFGDMSGITGEFDEGESRKRKRKTPSKGKGKKGGGGKKKRKIRM